MVNAYPEGPTADKRAYAQSLKINQKRVVRAGPPSRKPSGPPPASQRGDLRY